MEALWVLMLIAGREQDLTDLFAMRSQSIDLEEVSSKLVQVGGGRTRQVAVRLENRLNDPKLFHDALTRRELASPREGRNISVWAAFRKKVLSLVELR